MWWSMLRIGDRVEPVETGTVEIGTLHGDDQVVPVRKILGEVVGHDHGRHSR